MSRSRSAILIGTVLMTFIAPSAAWTQSYPRARSLEVGADVQWVGGSNLGTATAAETRNQNGGDRLTLFEASGRLGSATGIGGSIGFNVTPTIGVEVALGYNHPSIVASLAHDFEGASGILEPSRLAQYFADVGVVVHLTNLPHGRRTLPFVTASGGYLRQLTANPAVAETGRVYQVGGGLKQMLTARNRIGLKLDARVGVRDGGFSVGIPARRPFFIGRAGLFVVF